MNWILCKSLHSFIIIFVLLSNPEGKRFIRLLYSFTCFRLYWVRLFNICERCQVLANLGRRVTNRFMHSLYFFACVHLRGVRSPTKYFALGPFAHNPVRRPNISCVLYIDYLIKMSVDFFSKNLDYVLKSLNILFYLSKCIRSRRHLIA